MSAYIRFFEKNRIQELHISVVLNLFLCPFCICQKQKPAAPIKPEYQDTEDPEYEDFRAEASLQRNRQIESFAKAAEAFKQGRKEVASFYAQQVRSAMCVLFHIF